MEEKTEGGEGEGEKLLESEWDGSLNFTIKALEGK